MVTFKDKLLDLIAPYSWPERITLAAAALAIISPFFNWFHACTRSAGVYTCRTWNGFQWDNDLYGLAVFLLGLAIGYAQLQLKRGLQPESEAKHNRILLGAGILLVVIAIFRTLSFKGESTAMTSIGPSMGLLFVFAAGVATVLSSQLATIMQLLSSPGEMFHTARQTKRINKPAQIEQTIADDDEMPLDELEQLLNQGDEDALHKKIEQQRFDL